MKYYEAFRQAAIALGTFRWECPGICYTVAVTMFPMTEAPDDNDREAVYAFIKRANLKQLIKSTVPNLPPMNGAESLYWWPCHKNYTAARITACNIIADYCEYLNI